MFGVKHKHKSAEPMWSIKILGHIRRNLVAGLLLTAGVAATGSASAQDFINYEEPIGVFSATSPVRLDIGVAAVKQHIPSSHNSWATRLVVRRLDGLNSGPVMSDHLIGLFSETQQVRLDIGTRAMKQNIPASHRSWATVLKMKRLDGPNLGNVRYGDVVGVFSTTSQVRLDIGTAAMKENVPASHESWATRLNIRSVPPL